MKTQATVLVGATILSLLWACDINKPKAKHIHIIAREMKFRVSSPRAPAGLIDFMIQNKGPAAHELLIVKTDLPPDKLPVKDGQLDEKATSIEIVGEIEEENLPKGATKILRTNLAPGKYLLLCNLPGHFKAGEIAPFTVN